MKLSLNALKEKAGKVVTTELLGRISGGIENACHCDGKENIRIHQPQ